MNRFDRITAILIQLQSRKVVKAQDLADRFGTSLRTIYRDIRTLEEAGVPLYGEAGIGYSIVDGYRLPPVMFTQEEAMAFVTAEKLMEKFTDNAVNKNFSSAMYKVRSVLRGTEKDLLENLEEQILVTQRPRSNRPPDNILDTLLKAVADKKAVKMIYKAFGNDKSERLVEPIGIFYENDNWYTIGYCHLRKEYRQFRIDRVIEIKLTEQLQQERATLKEFQELQSKMKTGCELKKAVIRVEKNMALYLQEHKHYYGFISEIVTEEYVEMTFLTQWLEFGFARWFIMFADQAEIIEPESLKTNVANILDKILQKNTFQESC
ncbi:YafY family protein [Flavobacterium sp. NRK1]|uniref:helix-turn-helix transcriptional regulator n=1 Tax=Flavobacterium sp. NRK1 TaxID=2954929 RepID=UPI00209333D9|nr:YafY family protein [Flavobacterium sp. NRK1]MCO6149399.1 YafY family transcriptional regulator [Flavobacterium sp. NRK1]